MKLIPCATLLLSALFQLPVAGFAQKSATPDPRFHLYLLAGQSNMSGRGEIDSAGFDADERILMLNKENEWVVAKDPVHFDKKTAGVGPAISFAKKMLENEKDPKVKIGLIPCAVGGTPIAKWKPSAYYEKTRSHPYDDAIARTHEAVKTGVLKGVLWHQGEGNSSPGAVSRYLNEIDTLITRFRTEFGLPELPFVAGELGYFLTRSPAFNKMIRDLPARTPYTRVVSAAGLTDKGDSLHFNAESARELGIRYADGFRQLENLRIISPPDADAVTAYFQQFPENPSGSKIAFTVFHAPDTMEVVAKDLVSGKLTSVAKIRGQQRHNGAHPVWADDHILIYGSSSNYEIYRHNLKTGKTETYPGGEISSYSEKNNRVLYINKDERRGLVGFYALDFNTKETRCLVTVEDIAPLKNEIGTDNPVEYWKVIHPYWSPDGKKINFQITTAKGKSTAKTDYTFYSDENGKNIHFIGPKPIHPQWWDNETIYGHDWQDKRDLHVRRYDLAGNVVEEASGPGCHGAVSPDRKWIVTESWYGSDPIEVFLYKRGETKPAKLLYRQPATVNGIKFWDVRSHVHPAFSRDGKKVYFNAQGADGKSKVWCYKLTGKS